ncbi:hypothetical protein ALQ80_200041 [Pseudomonas coronafaciens pv. oryzae]|nr:hypothetical protein ALQ80_200041 [Pseudomonas coronafaciens pv. oryzae]
MSQLKESGLIPDKVQGRADIYLAIFVRLAAESNANEWGSIRLRCV